MAEEQVNQQEAPNQAENGQKSEPINVKIVLIGDDNVGKTSLCQFYRTGKTPQGEMPIIAPNFAKKEQYLTSTVILNLWDSACNSDYDAIRPRAYPNTNYFLLCFSLNDKKSLENALNIWYKEISSYSQAAKIFLIGTKADLKILNESTIDPIRSSIDPYRYIECSTITAENAQHIFDEITQITADPERNPKHSFRKEEKKPEEVETQTEQHKQTTSPPKSTTCLLL